MCERQLTKMVNLPIIGKFRLTKRHKTIELLKIITCPCITSANISLVSNRKKSISCLLSTKSSNWPQSFLILRNKSAFVCRSTTTSNYHMCILFRSWTAWTTIPFSIFKRKQTDRVYDPSTSQLPLFFTENSIFKTKLNS